MRKEVQQAAFERLQQIMMNLPTVQAPIHKKPLLLYLATNSCAIGALMAQKMEEKFSTFEIEHVPRNENRFANALAALGSQIMFKGDSTRVEVGKRKESIIERLKERFKEEQCEGD